VKKRIMTPSDIVYERPGPPPLTASAKMKQKTEEVRRVQQNLTRSQLAIATKSRGRPFAKASKRAG
jgi:hypothetical protein